jgi:hypothetical protein
MKSILLFSSLLHLVYGSLYKKCTGPEGTHESVFLEPNRSIDYCNKPGHSLKFEFDLEDKGIHSIKIYFINEDGRYAEDDTAYKIEEYKHGHGFHSRNLKIENFENGKYVFKIVAFDEEGYQLCHAFSPIVYYEKHCRDHRHIKILD